VHTPVRCRTLRSAVISSSAGRGCAAARMAATGSLSRRKRVCRDARARTRHTRTRAGQHAAHPACRWSAACEGASGAAAQRVLIDGTRANACNCAQLPRGRPPNTRAQRTMACSADTQQQQPHCWAAAWFHSCAPAAQRRPAVLHRGCRPPSAFVSACGLSPLLRCDLCDARAQDCKLQTAALCC
jgi:hypothetical protein